MSRAAVGTGVPMAIVPMGTGNLLARNLGVPMGPDEALAVALGGVRQPIDAGWVNGKLFVVMAGLGLDAQMLSGTSEVTLDTEQQWELDGEVMGPVRQLTVVAQPGGLMPPERA